MNRNRKGKVREILFLLSIRGQPRAMIEICPGDEGNLRQAISRLRIGHWRLQRINDGARLAHRERKIPFFTGCRAMNEMLSLLSNRQTDFAETTNIVEETPLLEAATA